MLAFGYYNMDCMDGMKHFPDKYFDLAVVDPEYGRKEHGGCNMFLMVNTKIEVGIMNQQEKNILMSY